MCVITKSARINKIYYILILLFFSISYAYSQENSQHIVVDSIRIIDWINTHESISDQENINVGLPLLSAIENQSLATIRTGGPSVLSTLLHRGMASRHMAVLWNGFNIQSVVNGTFDLGLIRNTFDQAKFYHNGTTSMTGNASIAGALSLENKLFNKNQTIIGISSSTAKNHSLSFINKFRSSKFYHHFAASLNVDNNEYKYINGTQRLTQKLAKFSSWDVNYEGNYLISNKVDLKGGIWLQNADRNIPPTKTSVSIKQEQKDVNYRGFMNLNYYASNESKFSFRSAYFYETIDYQAPGIFSLSEAKIYNSAIDFRHSSGIVISTQYRRDNVDATFFIPTYSRNTYAFLVDYSIDIKGIEIGASIRPEWVDGNYQPSVLGLRVKKGLSTKITSTLRYNKGYNLPSFNDLYWPNGGNADLKTERSQELELETIFIYGSRKSKSLGINVYYNSIDDWIQWTPIEGFFQPINQKKVRNIGFEIKLDESYKINADHQLDLNLLYGFTDSRIVKQYLNGANEGKRTIFIPVHKLTGLLSYAFKTWKVNAKPIYYSKRFDSVDNSTFVSGYFITDLEIIKKLSVKNKELTILLAIDNGLNNDYENIKFYPMPLRIFRLGLNFKL